LLSDYARKAMKQRQIIGTEGNYGLNTLNALSNWSDLASEDDDNE
jgi:hypothetical protein